MKMMQCEVCGGTDIKKIDDATLECQSCGVQYNSKEFEENEPLINADIEKPVSHKPEPTDEYSCFVEFEAYFKGHKDECLHDPKKKKVKALFDKTTITIPEGACLKIQSCLPQKRFDEIELFGHEDGTVSLGVAAGDKVGILKELSRLKAWVLLEEYLETGFIDTDELQLKDKAEVVSTQKRTAEKWARFFGIMGIFPFSFFLGIIPVFLLNKIKEENQGVLPKSSRNDLVLGVCGFCLWLVPLITLIVTA